MKNIHVILLNYTSQTLKGALLSLNLIRERILDVTILRNENITSFSNYNNIIEETNYISVNDNDLGVTLNNLISNLSGRYILFLHNQTLNSNIVSFDLNLSKGKKAITYSQILKKKVIQLPFFIEKDLLKDNKFFSKHELPFEEALFPSWLFKINKSYIKHTDQIIFSTITQYKTTNIVQKFNFVEKYNSPSKKTTDLAPTFSVMISNYNMERYIGSALNSCLLQHRQFNQILVIDDGSTDNSWEKMNEFSKYPHIRIFKKDNGGKAKALNYILPHINTEFVMELDADDWLDPDATLIVGDILRTIDKEVSVLYGNLRTWKQSSINNIRYKGIAIGKQIRNKAELLSYQFPLGPRIYRTNLLKSNKGFPIVEFENGRMYEDVSLLNHLLTKGNLLYRDFTIYNVREHGSSITKKNHPNWNDFLKYLN
ncbi:glycosyltransferase family 2 protein [Priestia megaterium]|uniref:glycosyltransferase family 2 protein n=2 Tax=Priestia megaterium TaxID=1404 RepID=UPI002FFF574D